MPDEVADSFSKLMLSLDYPMVVVTVAVDGQRAGCLVGFSTQVSIHPPRYLVGISDKNHTHGVVTRADTVAVHFPTGEQKGMAELFGGETGDEVDKFAQCSWTAGTDGVPLLDDIDRRFVARVVDRFPVGDHTGVLLEPIHVDVGERTEEGLTFQMVDDIDPGHDP